MGIDANLAEFGIPIVLISAVIIIALATMILHFLFPPSSGKCSVKQIRPPKPADEKQAQITHPA